VQSGPAGWETTFQNLNDILDLSETEAGRVPIQRISVSVLQSVSGVGSTGHPTKPIDRERLIATIRRHVPSAK
jgi:hypothetical protein